jgi:hypothetical protein
MIVGSRVTATDRYDALPEISLSLAVGDRPLAAVMAARQTEAVDWLCILCANGRFKCVLSSEKNPMGNVNAGYVVADWQPSNRLYKPQPRRRTSEVVSLSVVEVHRLGVLTVVDLGGVPG